MSFETIIYEADQHVATITLNRPERLNAITKQLENELFDALHAADSSEDIRVVVLTGAGRGFCAGADMSNLSAATETDWSSLERTELLERVAPPRPDPAAWGALQGPR